TNAWQNLLCLMENPPGVIDILRRSEPGEIGTPRHPAVPRIDLCQRDATNALKANAPARMRGPGSMAMPHSKSAVFPAVKRQGRGFPAGMGAQAALQAEARSASFVSNECYWRPLPDSNRCCRRERAYVVIHRCP